MIKKVTIENKTPERFRSTTLTKEEVGQAIDKVIRQLELNSDYFKEDFRHQLPLIMSIQS